MDKIRHIIFDCFGTLIDTGHNSQRAVERILHSVGAQVFAEEFYDLWKKIKREMSNVGEFRNEKELFRLSLNKAFAEYDIKADADVEVKPMIEAIFSKRYAYPEVKDALAALLEKGYDIVIGSTTDTEPIDECLKLNGIEIDKVFTSEAMRVYKPSERFYRTILDNCGWKTEECVFVGDNYEDDVCGPKQIGMRAVLLDRNEKYETEKLSPKPDYVIRSLTELLDIL